MAMTQIISTSVKPRRTELARCGCTVGSFESISDASPKSTFLRGIHGLAGREGRELHAFGAKLTLGRRNAHATGNAGLAILCQTEDYRNPVFPLEFIDLCADAHGMKFCICNEIFQDWKLEDTLAYAARIGYQAVEIAPFTLANSVTDISADERGKIRSSAARHRIEIAGIHWVLVKPEGLYMNHTDASIRERTAQYFSDLVDFCADIGGKIMVVGSPKQRNVLPEVTREQAWTWAVNTFKPATALAEKRGVTICIEPLSPAETNFINTAEEAIKFMRELKSPNFKIILDVKAMSSESKPIPQIIRDSWPHFAHFHANDKNLKGPGFGDVDFTPIAAALKEVGYKGYVSVEVFKFEEGPQAIATRSLEYMKSVWGPAK
jgi:sugar phosphate isomerase/epimerase